MIQADLTYDIVSRAQQVSPHDAHIQIFLSFPLSPFKAIHHCFPCYTEASVTLRIEEDLAIPDIHSPCTIEITHCKIEVILLSLEHGKATVVRFEEGQCLFSIVHGLALSILHGIMRILVLLKRREGLAGPRMCEFDPIALRELPLELWRYDTLNVYVQFDLWHCKHKWILIL